jgi:addiction module RelB/DinJ family antitoxin
MTKTTINIKADKDVKENAQKVARELGIPLSTIINAYLNQLIRTKKVHFFVDKELKPSIKKRLDRLSREAKNGKNLSPTFKNVSEAIRYLRSL